VTEIKVSYATDVSDPLDLMSPPELEVERARQLEALREEVRRQQNEPRPPS
jgi:hypothetical protein